MGSNGWKFTWYDLFSLSFKLYHIESTDLLNFFISIEMLWIFLSYTVWSFKSCYVLFWMKSDMSFREITTEIRVRRKNNKNKFEFDQMWAGLSVLLHCRWCEEQIHVIGSVNSPWNYKEHVYYFFQQQTVYHFFDDAVKLKPKGDRPDIIMSIFNATFRRLMQTAAAKHITLGVQSKLKSSHIGLPIACVCEADRDISPSTNCFVCDSTFCAL